MKTLSYTGALFALFLSLPVVAQQPSAAAPRPSASKTAPSPVPKAKGLTVDGIAAMAEAGLSDDVIMASLRKEDKAFDLSADDMIHLKKAKVSDAVIKVMLDPKADSKATVAVPASEPRQVAAQAPLLQGVVTPKPSGATPPAGLSAVGDANDPMAPHDSGIYLYTKDRDGKPQMIVLERAAYQGSKTGGLLPSAMSYGLIKAKTKAVIPGPKASIRVSDASAVFYFYFDDKQAGLGKTYFGVGSLSNPNQFALLKLEVNKANRETVIGKFSALGSSSGSDANAMIPFKSERIRPGLYKVSVEGVKVGEYCFLASGNQAAATPYAAGAAMAADIFDFGVGEE